MTTPPVRPTNLLEGTLFFGLCAAGSDRLEVVAIYILAVVQRHPRRQTGSQTLKLMGPLPPEAEGVKELIVDAFDDLAYPSYPSLLRRLGQLRLRLLCAWAGG